MRCVAILIAATSLLGGNRLVLATQKANDYPVYLGRAIYDWGADLKHNDASTRRLAAFALGKFGPFASHYGADLRAAMEDADAGVREAAASALGEIGPLAGREAIPALKRALVDDSDPAVRRSAASSLGRIEQFRHEAYAPLRLALTDADPRVRQTAAWALGQLGTTVDIGEAVLPLRSLLSDADSLVRRDAAAALGSVGPGAKPAVANLIVALADVDPVVRPNAALALGKIGPASEMAAPILVKLVQDPGTEEDLRHQAAFALSQIGGPKVAQSLPQLRECLRDKDVLIRRYISAVFLNQGEHAQFYLPDLAAALADESTEVRQNVSAAMEKAARHADESAVKFLVPLLIKSLQKEPDGTVRRNFAWIFLNLSVNLHSREFASVKDALIRIAVSDKEFDVRSNLARACVVHFGPEARDVAPSLIESLKQPHNTVRVVRNTSAKADSGRVEGAEGSTALQEEEAGDGRAIAAEFLGRLGSAAGSAATQALEEAAKDPDSKELRDAAKRALERIRTSEQRNRDRGRN
jgi:HEAT repeat protein